MMIWGKPKKMVIERIECPHCGYIEEKPHLTKEDDEDSTTWICPACQVYSTVYEGGKIDLGYHRTIKVNYEID